MTTTPTSNARLGMPGQLHNGGLQEDIAGLKVQHYGGMGPNMMTEFRFQDFALAITDALAYSSRKIFTFPRGKIQPLMAVSHLTFTTTSAIATTLLTGATVSYGFGTAAATSLTLATTMQDFLPGTGIAVATFASSTVINVASAAVTHAKGSTPIVIDGSVTALPVYFNLGVAAASIDGDATLTCTGRLLISWCNLGGWAYYAGLAE